MAARSAARWMERQAGRTWRSHRSPPLIAAPGRPRRALRQGGPDRQDVQTTPARQGTPREGDLPGKPGHTQRSERTTAQDTRPLGVVDASWPGRVALYERFSQPPPATRGCKRCDGCSSEDGGRRVDDVAPLQRHCMTLARRHHLGNYSHHSASQCAGRSGWNAAAGVATPAGAGESRASHARRSLRSLTGREAPGCAGGETDRILRTGGGRRRRREELAESTPSTSRYQGASPARPLPPPTPSLR